ncbi:MAG: GNAT family N-acetyltransferase [Steroidobacteraceae bacterium]
MSEHRARFIDHIAEVDAAAWNALVSSHALRGAAGQPFLRHEFLSALEQSGSVAARTGWAPKHLLLEDSRGRMVGAMPLYRKAHSRGEFVFDFSWANAYAEHGMRYYPKLVAAVPFTPVTGPRLLVGASADERTVSAGLIRAASEYARSEHLSSWHLLFPADEDLTALRQAGLILRRDCQFHWQNRAYGSYEDFLATFTAEKRKKARRERRRVAEAGIEFDTRLGGDMSDDLWRTVYRFYADTFFRHGHEPYLNLRFFKLVAASMPGCMMIKVARHGREPIAAAIFFVGEDALFGRYWGAGGNYHSLHFEACYHQGIEYCIEHGLQRFEPGTQGEHKVPRGFVPTLTSSAHDIVDARFEAAIRDFAAREARGVASYAAAVNKHVPYHRVPNEELQL